MTTHIADPRPSTRLGTRRRFIAVLGVTSLALGLAACGSDEPTNATGNGDDAELEQVTVGAIPIGDVAPLHVAISEGFFEEEGLEVEIVNTTGGAVAVPGVVAGDYDFAFGNTVSLMVARDQGLPLRYVSNGATTTGEPGADFAAVVAPEDSELHETADLSGEQTSSNNLNNIGDTAIRLAVDEAGADGADIEFVELAFGEAEAAVTNGNVSSALLLEPYLTAALDHGLKPIAWPYAEAHPDLDIGGYFTSEETLADRPDTVEAFQRAMERSLEFSQDNPEVVREVIGTYTTIDEEMLERITLPRFSSEFSREGLSVLGEAAARHGVISEEPNLDELLPPQ
ncbi:ABC transporter substrate-binding protein [Citricoccus muralis]|uniref:ABC transporter substrate-binding protein n=1 Tax=Citricoccus muralis TaxID=169134 RepID=A0ABY8H626_9MICC|nr:ABC transporter substrate-binding protein [Citricoccus muralis]WFP16107.1 ABC transporter substrate-binding protein [Citricoccus muralis]